MLDESYLTIGLNALSRAHERNYFADGHLGAAVIAAYYLCKENGLEDKTQDAIGDCIDAELHRNDLFAQMPNESSDPSLLEQVLQALAPNIIDLRDIGHNAIFSCAALKAFRQVPEAITPSRVKGICSLIAAFDSTQNVDVKASDEIPVFEKEDLMVEFVFREFLASLNQYVGFGQGWAGHLLTFGHALVELSRLGHADLAKSGQTAYRMYIKTMRQGPKALDPHITEHVPKPWTPLDSEYWQNRKPGISGIGHVFKYPYSFYALLKHVSDPELTQQCIDESYRIF